MHTKHAMYLCSCVSLLVREIGADETRILYGGLQIIIDEISTEIFLLGREKYIIIEDETFHS